MGIKSNIPSGANLNDYTNPDTYIALSTVVASLLNKPVSWTTTGGIIKVDAYSSAALRMTIETFNGHRYWRNWLNGSWDSIWHEETIPNNLTSFLGAIYWSGIESINLTANTITYGNKTITLPAGRYIVSAHAELPAGSEEATLGVSNLTPVERQIVIPISSSFTRRATVTFIADISSEKTINVFIYCTTTLTAANCEVSAICIR